MADDILVRYKADIKQLQSQLDNLEKSFKETDQSIKSTDKAVKGFEKTGNQLASSIKNVGATLGVAFGAQTLISGIKEIINVNREFEKSLSTLSSITGATGKDLAFFEEQARRIGATTTLSATQAAEAFTLIGSAQPELLKIPEALVAVTDAAATLAEASGLELPAAADALTTALNQFSLSGEDAERVINVLAASSKEGAVAIPTLAESLRVVGTVAAAAGVSVEETSALIETLGEKGITGAQAGTQLRNVFLRLQQQGIGFVDGVFDINAALQELEDRNLSTTEAAKIFGLESATAGKILVDNKDRFEELSIAVAGTDTAFEQAAINTDNLDGSLARFSSSLEALILEGGALNDAFRNIVDFGTELLDTFSSLANSTSFTDFANNATRAFLRLVIRGVSPLIESLEAIGVIEEGFADSLLEATNVVEKQEDSVAGLNEELTEQEKAIQRIIEEADKREQQAKAQAALDEQNRVTLEKLEKQLKDLEKVRKDLTVTDTQALILNGKQIQGLRNQIEGIKNLGLVSKDAEKEAEERQKNAIKRINDLGKASQDAFDEQIEEGKRLAEEEEALGQFRADQAVKGAKTIEQRVQKEIEAEELRTRDLIASQGLTGDALTLANEQLEAKITEIRAKGKSDREALDKKEAQKRAENFERIGNAVIEGSALVSDAFAVQSQRRLSDLEKERQDALANFVGTEEQREQLEEQFRAKEAKIKRDAAIKEKAASLFEVTLQGAIAAVKAGAALPPPANIPLIALSAAQTAAQAALILATPIPEFAVGTESAPGGLSKVHKDEYMWLPQGAKVFTKKASGLYNDEIKAMNDGYFDDLMFAKYIQPALSAQLEEMGKNGGHKMGRGDYNDYNLRRDVKRPINMTDSTINKLATAISRNTKSSRFKGWK